MTTATLPQFVVCRYVPDLRRQEPRNIGVVLLHEAGVLARFIGEDLPGMIDARKARPIISDHLTYAQWVDYWRYCLEPANALNARQNPRQTNERVLHQLLASSKGNFIVSDPNEVLISGLEDKDPIALLSYLYNEIVEAEPDVPEVAKLDIERVSHKLIYEAGLNTSPLFMQNEPINIINKRGKRETLRPGYVLINQRYNVLEPIALHASSPKSGQRAVDAVQYMYERLEIHARTANNREARFVSLLDATPGRYTYDIRELVDVLSGWGPVVDIARPDESKEVLASVTRAVR